MCFCEFINDRMGAQATLLVWARPLGHTVRLWRGEGRAACG